MLLSSSFLRSSLSPSSRCNSFRQIITFSFCRSSSFFSEADSRLADLTDWRDPMATPLSHGEDVLVQRHCLDELSAVDCRVEHPTPIALHSCSTGTVRSNQVKSINPIQSNPINHNTFIIYTCSFIYREQITEPGTISEFVACFTL